jgi:hypothetical protein
VWFPYLLYFKIFAALLPAQFFFRQRAALKAVLVKKVHPFAGAVVQSAEKHFLYAGGYYYFGAVYARGIRYIQIRALRGYAVFGGE